MHRLFLFISLMMFSMPAFSFTLVSTFPGQMGWASNRVTFLINDSNCPAGMDIRGLIEDAADAWNGVPTSNIEVRIGDSTTSTAMGDPPVVYCATSFNAATGADENSVPGAANPRPNGKNINGGVLILNVSSGAANISRFDSAKLKVILAHEIGHILGLGHSEEETALMYFSVGSKQEFNLAQDDIDGISYLYPRDELGKDGIAGCASVKSLSPPMPPSGVNMLSLLAIIALPFLLNCWLKKNRPTPRTEAWA